jgi:hypothetical protein
MNEIETSRFEEGSRMTDEEKASQGEGGWRLITPEKLREYIERKAAPSIDVKVEADLLPYLFLILKRLSLICEEAAKVVGPGGKDQVLAEARMWSGFAEKLSLQEKKMKEVDRGG